MNTATPQQIDLLHHTLGLSAEQRKPYRNHYVASKGHYAMQDLEALEALGLMRRGRTPAFCDQRDIVFIATDTGRALALEQLPAEPLHTRYDDFLAADGGRTFGEHLCGNRLPVYEQRGTAWRRDCEYRMYRGAEREAWHVAGEWAKTKKDAKASYKAALAAYRTHVKREGAAA